VPDRAASSHPIIRADRAGGREAVQALLGLIPPWAKDPAIGGKLANARAETVMEKPAFREAFRSRRCIVPVTSIDRWSSSTRQHYQICRRDGVAMGLAGLWSVWTDPANGDEVTTFAVITCAANALLFGLHDRMPVILDPAEYDVWLDPTRGGPELLRPCPEEWLEVVAVDRKRRDDPPGPHEEGEGPATQGRLF
jgi:putative SOS response-associated peptidase YedK